MRNCFQVKAWYALLSLLCAYMQILHKQYGGKALVVTVL